MWGYTTNGYEQAYSGDEDDDEIEVNYVNDGFNLNYYVQTSGEKRFLDRFGPDNDGQKVGRWVVRYSTGDKLMTDGKYDYYGPIKSRTGFVKDVYRYNAKEHLDAGPQWEARTETDIQEDINSQAKPLEKAVVGCLIGEDGLFYRDKETTDKAGVKPVALVVHIGTEQRVENGKPWNALAIALTDLNVNGTTQFKWQDAQVDSAVVMCTTVTTAFRAGAGAVRPGAEFPNFLDGWAMTQRLKAHSCGHDHHHPAAEAIGALKPVPGCSEWFIPSTGQWILALQGLGFRWENVYTSMFGGYYSWEFTVQDNELWKKAGVETVIPAKSVWMTTQSGENAFFSHEGNTTSIGRDTKNVLKPVRPLLAFQMGNSATQDAVLPTQPIQPRVGAVLADNGYFYNTMADVQEVHTKPEAMVAYMGGSHRVVKGESYNGLAILVKNDGTTFEDRKGPWCSSAVHEGLTCSSVAATYDQYEGCIDGLEMTNKIGRDGHSHTAVSWARNTNTSISRGPFSDSFLPSVGHWIMAMKGMGYTWGNANGPYEFTGNGKWLWDEAGLADQALKDGAAYWTTTEMGDKDHKVITFTVGAKSMTQHKKTEELYYRPFIAFGNSAYED
ncbi:MAG: hypothetical protein K6D55_11895 [Prevotella sp.]|nr:hypothetical protein [Prevotella sp.]